MSLLTMDRVCRLCYRFHQVHRITPREPENHHPMQLRVSLFPHWLDIPAVSLLAQVNFQMSAPLAVEGPSSSLLLTPSLCFLMGFFCSFFFFFKPEKIIYQYVLISKYYHIFTKLNYCFQSALEFCFKAQKASPCL